MPIIIIIAILLVLGLIGKIGDNWGILLLIALIIGAGIAIIALLGPLGIVGIVLIGVFLYRKNKKKEEKAAQEKAERDREIEERCKAAAQEKAERDREIEERCKAAAEKERTRKLEEKYNGNAELQEAISKIKYLSDEEIWDIAKPFIYDINLSLMPEIDDESYDLEFRHIINYLPDTMPWGRVNAFLNSFNADISNENPWLFHALRSKKTEELREYGVVITDKALYAATQKPKYDEHDKISGTEDYCYRIPWAGLKAVGPVREKDAYTFLNFEYLFEDGEKKTFRLKTYYLNTEAIKQIAQLSQALIDNGITRLYMIQAGELSDDFLNQGFKIYKENISDDSVLIKLGLWNSADEIRQALAENKNLMNGRQGGGYAAEYGNNTFDRVQGINAENTAQNLDANGRQVKAGADRTVDGVEVQTKYYKTASESIAAAFDNKQAVYLRSDGSGKMMVIEVPRDQYYEARDLMQKRIDDGQVPGVEPGENASNYVKRGYFTYSQAWNIAKAGTVESLTVDIASGVISTSSACGISVMLKFAYEVWQGKSVTDAVKDSMIVGMNVLGRGVFVYTLTAQLSREQIAIPFIQNKLSSGQIQGMASFKNPIYALSEEMVNRITASTLAKSAVGQAIGLETLTEKALISNALFAAVSFGPDVVRYMSGDINGTDFAVNASLTGACMAGFAAGNAIIPGIGGIIGGAVVGGLGKMFVEAMDLDWYMPEMYGVIKQEFLEAAVVNGLSKKETEHLAENTIQRSDLRSVLKAMHDYNNDPKWDEYDEELQGYDQRFHSRVYFHDNYIQPVLDEIFQNRKNIKLSDYYFGLGRIEEEKA